ncbi:MAG: hypothetical protein ACXWV0_04865 [Flavisolibacter sp.]
MKTPKPTLIGLILLICGLQTGAQFKLSRLPRVPVTNNELRINLQKVIADFPNHFSELRGDTLEVNPQTIEYSSRLDFSMAPINTIMEYRSLEPRYSWQAQISTTEEFEEASQKYDWLCKQLKVMTIKLDGGYTFSLNGDYEAPDETLGFCSSIYKLTPNASNMPRLKIEVTMQFEFPEWKVNLVVYEKEREDHERGEISGD